MNPARRSAQGGESGSIFIEAVVALAILAGLLGAACQIMAASAVRHRGVEARRHALMVTRSVVARLGFTIPLSTGAAQGEDDGDAWRIDTRRCGAGDSDAGVLYCVTVSAGGAIADAPLIRLNTVRLGPRT